MSQSPAGDGYTLIYIPSYFDFVRLRNWFSEKIREVDRMRYCELSEYTTPGDVTRGRAMFSTGQVHYVLFTERFHFYHR